jgi:hypothetical protein
MPTAYLRQLKTGRIYPWTPTIAKRKDMVPYDPELAEAMIQALKDIIAQMQAANAVDPEQQAKHVSNVKAAQDLAAELNELEAQAFGDGEEKEKKVETAAPGQPPGKTPEQQQEQERQSVIDADPHIKEIMAMAKPKQIMDYLKREFGVTVEEKGKSVEALRNMAINHRIDRIFEG